MGLGLTRRFATITHSRTASPAFRDRDPGATLDDLREAVTTLEELERTARRVLGGAHPLTTAHEKALQAARATLRAHAAARICRTFQTIWRKRKKLASFDE